MASDFMADVFRSLGFEYVFAMPASTFVGIHESVVNYLGNKNPEWITCMHEEASVGMACGYAKIEGKPVMICAHGTVGLQHASMNIYEAWCDHVPVFLVLGNTLDASRRGNEVGWVHSVQDTCAMVRDYVKWDDTPVSLAHFTESAVRAYKIAMTPPYGPVAIVADSEMQDERLPANFNVRVPKVTIPTAPQGDLGSVREAAKLLVAAENPVIVAGRTARTPNAVQQLVELAETLQASVVDQRRRMNFPTRHPLSRVLFTRVDGRTFTDNAVGDADVILGLESSDIYNAIAPRQRAAGKPKAKVINVTASDLGARGNYQDFMRFAEVDMAITGDGEATLPVLIDEVKRLITADRRRTLDARGKKIAEANQKAREQTRAEAAYGWDSSPVSTARLSAEIWEQIKNEDFSLLSDAKWIRNWPLRMWDFTKSTQYIGGAGAEGVGTMAPVTVGAALANKKYGRLSISIQTDGDLMVVPNVLWTAAHHKIPLLTIMHNNRGYHMEVMGYISQAARANRSTDTFHIGNTFDNPFIDYAKLAQSLGVRAEGPIADPKDLAAAIRRGIQVVKSGEPYLIDVLTQPR
jgi:acetolactate synthase I/II/III large subunit